MRKHLETLGLGTAILGAVVSVLALAMSCTYKYFGIDFGLSETHVFGVPGVNGWMQFLLLVGAFMLFLGVLPMGAKGARFVVLEAQLTASGVAFFLFHGDTLVLYTVRVLILISTFFALWRFHLMRGSIVKIGSVGTELLGWGKALNSSAGLAAGGDLLFISSYLSYKRHGGKLDLLWTLLNAPFAVFAHLDLAASMADHLGWSEVIHLHIAGLVVLGAAFFLVLNARTGVDLDGPHKPRPSDDLLPRFDLRWSWDTTQETWRALGACGTPFVGGNNYLHHGTVWERENYRHQLSYNCFMHRRREGTLEPRYVASYKAIPPEVKATIRAIRAHLKTFGVTKVGNRKWLRLDEQQNVRRTAFKRRERQMKERRKSLDPLGWALDKIIPGAACS